MRKSWALLAVLCSTLVGADEPAPGIELRLQNVELPRLDALLSRLSRLQQARRLASEAVQALRERQFQDLSSVLQDLDGTFRDVAGPLETEEVDLVVRWRNGKWGVELRGESMSLAFGQGVELPDLPRDTWQFPESNIPLHEVPRLEVPRLEVPRLEHPAFEAPAFGPEPKDLERLDLRRLDLLRKHRPVPEE